MKTFHITLLSGISGQNDIGEAQCGRYIISAARSKFLRKADLQPNPALLSNVISEKATFLRAFGL
jgi:hypothetical protein